MSQTTEYRIIDTDTHLTEPAGVWTDRVAVKYRDRVPRVAWDDEGQEEAWFLGDVKLVGAAMSAIAGWDEAFPGHPPTFELAHPAAYDAEARLKLMDETGTWAHVLYPNIGGFGNQEFLKLDDPELMLSCVRAYNDFQRDWCAPAPDRFITMIATPFWDVDACKLEIERSAKLGHRGVLFTGAPQDYGLPPLASSHWDPLWAAAQDAELPISFHIGSGDFLDREWTAERVRIEGMEACYARTTTNLFFENGKQMCDLLLSGVLPRFPRLKFVSVESGIGWIPFLLEAVDYHFEAADVGVHRPEFEMRPSDYFRRQVFGCYWFERTAPTRLLEQVGIENILFETDFPHTTCLYGNVAETIEAGIGDQPEAVQERILWRNAAELYHVEGPGH